MNLHTPCFPLLAVALLAFGPAKADMVGLPACTFEGQPMSVDLSTSNPATPTTPTNWQVTGPGASGPTHTADPAWTALQYYWIQPNLGPYPQFMPQGYYTYLIRFFIPCKPQNYAGLSLTGRIAADNSFKAYVNGNLFATCAGPNCFSYPGNPTTFANLAGYLVRGVNAIQIVVYNRDTITGLAVSATLTARCGQECCQMLRNLDMLHGTRPQ
ncbi:MAG TPA: hypothetical protein VG889_20815 [Rhizomicrobium sp.]|nr:hypothetical protein [Rhizomicrobium sp.]